jgi:methyl-accepting chemotaxis protein
MSDNTAPEAAANTPASTADSADAFVQDPVLAGESAEPAPAPAHPAAPAQPTQAHAQAHPHAQVHPQTPPAAHAHSHAAAPAVHAGISVDERAYEQYQALARAVLESAELAGRSTEAALAISRDLKMATGNFKEMSEAGYKKARLLLAIGGGVMVVCLLFFLIMGVRMVSRINKLDVMMEAVGKRVVDLNSGMESLDGINKSVQELSNKQTELTKAQGQIEGRIDAQLKQSESLVSKVPTETAKQVAATSDTLKREVQGINSRLQSQANAVQNLGNEVKALKGSVGNVDGLKRDVEALVTLQRERYLEALQKNNASTARERAVQYPRVPASGAAPAAAGLPTVNAPAKP